MWHANFQNRAALAAARPEDAHGVMVVGDDAGNDLRSAEWQAAKERLEDFVNSGELGSVEVNCTILRLEEGLGYSIAVAVQEPL